MFDIHTLTLLNFRSYNGEHKFTFPEGKGLYYLTGKNDLEPALGANGAGKSTFLDAITWVLYGRTTRGLKATDVLSWHGKGGAQVIIEMTVGDDRYVIKRSQKPNVLTINDKPVDQQELETHLRLNYAGFTHSVINPQFGTSFFSMTASDKLTLFSDFMALDFWLEKSEQAAVLAKAHQESLSDAKNKVVRVEAQIEMLTADIEALEVKSQSFKAEQTSKLKELEQEFADNYILASKLNKQVVQFVKDKKALEAERRVIRAWVKNCTEKRDLQIEEVQSLGHKQKDLIRQREYHERAIERLRALKGGSCPTCEQNLDPGHMGSAVRQRQANIAELNFRIERGAAAHQKLMKNLIEAKGHLEVRERQLEDNEDAISKLDSKIARYSSRSDSTANLLDQIRKRMDEIDQTGNPHAAAMEEKRQSGSHLRARLSALLDNVGQCESYLLAAEYWAKGFKRIRLTIIETAFQTLELEVNNCLAQLGMTDWQVSFDIERENKSGGITKGFVVMVQGPTNTVPVKWENWSGGETQRLQLAGDLGLANLIMQQAGLRSEIEFYDEPSTHLSPEGMMDLADVLHERATTQGKKIWIADHAAISSFGSFEGIVIARKDKHGSSITAK